MRTRPAMLWLDLAVKAALLGLLLFAVLRQDLPQFSGKAMTGRALTYPLAALVVPIGWWLTGRKRGSSYPYALDILLVLPFLIDTAGNALNVSATRPSSRPPTPTRSATSRSASAAPFLRPS